MSIPGPAAQRAAEVPGPHLQLSAQRQQLARAASGRSPRAPSSLSTARSGRAMSPDEQRVAGQHGPRLGAARGVDQRERRVLGPVARGVQRAHAHAPELQLPAVVERLVVVVGLARRGGCGSSRRSRRPAARGRRRGRRGCASRGCARSTRPCSARASRYSSISSFGSTTAATPASSSPTRYEAQPRSSWVIWRKINETALYRDADWHPKGKRPPSGRLGPPPWGRAFVWRQVIAATETNLRARNGRRK